MQSILDFSDEYISIESITAYVLVCAVYLDSVEHAVDLQQNCLAVFDSLNYLADAALCSKQWDSHLYAIEMRFKKCTKQATYRIGEVLRVLESSQKQMTSVKVIRMLEPRLMPLYVHLIHTLPELNRLIEEASRVGQASCFYFDAYEEEKERKERAKRQKRVSTNSPQLVTNTYARFTGNWNKTPDNSSVFL